MYHLLNLLKSFIITVLNNQMSDIYQIIILYKNIKKKHCLRPTILQGIILRKVVD